MVRAEEEEPVERDVGKGIKLVLTKEQKLARQTKQISKIIRDAIHAKRSLNGKGMKNVEGVFKAIDKDGSGNLDYDEFAMAMNRLGLGLTEEQVAQSIEVRRLPKHGQSFRADGSVSAAAGVGQGWRRRGQPDGVHGAGQDAREEGSEGD